ncbi:membrane protein [Streptosporangium fragile]|uniref:Membrane protein n=1 Tax=Streptosporangium fragile TaxID=46186 RepID=A0ABN3WBD9_9ACTN
MTKFLLSVHVLAAIIAIGPVTVAASMFPPAVRRARAAGADAVSLSSVRLLHRICRVYSVVGLAVPVFGFATASSLGVLGDAWLIASIVLTAAAAGVLALLVLPGQERLIAGLDGAGAPVARGATSRLGMLTGVFNLLWAIVTVLMIVRPGSTTGV